MKDKPASRLAFEQWYTEHAFDYQRDPIGSRDCSLQWDAWRARDAEITELQAELAITNKLLDTRNELLALIPACEAHGDQCVPHAKEWVTNIKSWKESVLAEVGEFEGNKILTIDQDDIDCTYHSSLYVEHLEQSVLHLAVKLVEAQSWQESVLAEANRHPFNPIGHVIEHVCPPAPTEGGTK